LFLNNKYPGKFFVRWMARLAGIKDFLSTDIYVDESHIIKGKIGLYRTSKDA